MDAEEDVGEAPAAGRRAPLLEVLPQEQLVDPVPEVPMLHVIVPQTVEQLVEALTIVSLIEVIRQPVEQPVGIPVRAWDGTGGRLHGFLPGQHSSSSVEQIANIPAPHHGFYGGFQGFHPGQSSTAVAEQIVTSQFRTVAGTSKILVSHRFLKKLLRKSFKGFWHFSPAEKKCAVGSALGIGTECGL